VGANSGGERLANATRGLAEIARKPPNPSTFVAPPAALGRGMPVCLEPFPISLNQIVVIASEAWRSIGSDSNEPWGSPRFARDDGVFP
jgi:hypothetical protein